MGRGRLSVKGDVVLGRKVEREEAELERDGNERAGRAKARAEATRFATINEGAKAMAAMFRFEPRVDHAGSSMLGGR